MQETSENSEPANTAFVPVALARRRTPLAYVVFFLVLAGIACALATASPADLPLGIPALLLSVIGFVGGIIGWIDAGGGQPDAAGRRFSIAAVWLSVAGVILAFFTMNQVGDGAARLRSASNMRQIGIALHNYHFNHESFPENAIRDPLGKPLLSWRVTLLPLLGDEEELLYRRFRLDEPWDSEHNLKLLARMPDIYRSPTDPKDATETYYQLVVGEHAAFADGRKTTLQMVMEGDGTEQTIMLVEAGRSVPWTKPEDVTFDLDGPLPVLGGIFNQGRWYNRKESGVHVVFVDGRLRFLRPNTSEATLRALMTYRQGDRVELE